MKKLTFFLVFISGFLVGSCFLLLIAFSNIFLLQITYGEYLVGIGTIALAVFTGYLGYETAESSKKERRRQRLKEQLEGLYSPLMPYIEHIEGRAYDNPSFISKLDQIKGLYEFLATPKLKELLRDYFNKHRLFKNNEEWSEFIKPVIDRIIEDNDTLLQEYAKLTTL